VLAARTICIGILIALHWPVQITHVMYISRELRFDRQTMELAYVISPHTLHCMTCSTPPVLCKQYVSELVALSYQFVHILPSLLGVSIATYVCMVTKSRYKVLTVRLTVVLQLTSPWFPRLHRKYRTSCVAIARHPILRCLFGCL
jgi:hypothetical protein